MKNTALKSGLTLLEVIVVIALLGLILLVSTPYLFGNKDKNDLMKETNMLAEHLRLAQQKSIAAEQGLEHGIKFDNSDGFILIPENKVIKFKTGILIDPFFPTQITFSKLTGKPSTSLNIELKFKNYKTKVEVNNLGVVIEYPLETI